MCAELWQILRGELGDAIAARVIDRIRSQLGGRRVYLPHPERPGKRAISDAYANHADAAAIAARLGVSRRTVYRYR